jgi:type II secretory pathway pseudopilin PulG
MTDEAVRIASLLFWTKTLVVIAIIAIVTDIVALAMFVTFRRNATQRLDQQKEVLENVTEVLDLMKRHAEMAREQKDATKQALCDIKTEAQKTISAAAVAADKVIDVAKDTAKQLDDLKSVVIAAVPTPQG